MTLVRYGIPLSILLGAGVLSQVTSDLRWHLLHGFHVEANGNRFRIPLSYRTLEDPSNGNLTLVANPGFLPQRRERLKYGTIRFDFRDTNASTGTSSEATRPKNLRITLSLGPIEFSKTNERPVELAGYKGSCVEYSGRTLPSDVAEFGDKTVKISCWFNNDATASFIGAPASVQDFYDIIQSAQTVEGRR